MHTQILKAVVPENVLQVSVPETNSMITIVNSYDKFWLQLLMASDVDAHMFCNHNESQPVQYWGATNDN